MPTAYPGANDTFTVPSSPANTPLASAGDSTRGHTQSHQDLGDALVALQKNAALLTHDHSNTEARPTTRLLQVNTHQSADTDSADTALHHTIGTNAHQAADGPTVAAMRTQLFGGATRTQGYRGRAIRNQSTGYTNYATGTDLPATIDNWAADGSVDSGDNMIAVDGARNVYALAPVAGTYRLTWLINFIALANGQYINACSVLNTIAENVRLSALLTVSQATVAGSGQALTLAGSRMVHLAANDKVYFTFAATTGSNFQMVGSVWPNACSSFELQWVSA
jgi:hypothetical protein